MTMPSRFRVPKAPPVERVKKELEAIDNRRREVRALLDLAHAQQEPRNDIGFAAERDRRDA